MLRSKAVALGAGGILLALVGGGLLACWPDIFKVILAQKMELRKDSETYEAWKNPPIPMFLDIYFYNWTNHEDFTNKSSKPILVEVGPYRFHERKDKVNITWHDHNQTVSFLMKSMFYFDEENSKGSLDDNITTLNVVALSAAHQARNWSTMRKMTVSMGLSVYDEQVHVTRTANELLFEGYESDLINMALAAPSLAGDGPIPFDRFGWFYTRNGSESLTGHYNMHTGVGDISQIGTVKQWNYDTKTPFFPGTCGQVNGTDAEFYPPNKDRTKPISFFTPDLCRSITFDYEKDVTVRNINAYKYSGGAKTVDNGTLYPENACFCNGECVPSGVLNISSCRFGTPVFMSFPHFYAADPYYLDGVEGLSPDKDKHSFYISLEPNTGIPLDVAARFQVNLLVEPNKDVALYSEVPHVFFPVIWFEQRVTITEPLADQLKYAILAPRIGQAVAAVFLLVGLAMLLWHPLEKLYSFQKSKDSRNQKKSKPLDLVNSRGFDQSIREKDKIELDSVADKDAESEIPLLQNGDTVFNKPQVVGKNNVNVMNENKSYKDRK